LEYVAVAYKAVKFISEARVKWDGKAGLFCDEMQAKPFVAWMVDETEPLATERRMSA